MASPRTRNEHKQYCLRSLGHPVIQINVADEQLEDRIDESLEHMRLYHWEGIERIYYKHLITEEDVTNGFIDLPEHIYGVKRLIPIRQGSSGTNLFDVQYQLKLTDIYELNNANLITYTSTMSYMALLDQMLNGYPSFEFSKLSGRLFFEMGTTKLTVGHYIIIEAYIAIDESGKTNGRFWGDNWFLSFTEALIKKQWGSNLKKYSGLQLPGGVTIDGTSLYNEAIQELKDLKDELMNKSAPLAMVIG